MCIRDRYRVGRHASNPYTHKLLLHTDTVLKPYPLVESLEREVFDERYTVYPVSYTHLTDLMANAATAAHYNEDGDLSVTAFDASKGYDLMAASALNLSLIHI